MVLKRATLDPRASLALPGCCTRQG